MLRRNEWRYVADDDYVSIVRFCKNVGMDEYFLRVIPLFCKNVCVGEYFLCAMPSFCKNVGIE